MEGKVHRKFGKKEKNYQKTIQELNRQHADDLRKVMISFKSYKHFIVIYHIFSTKYSYFVYLLSNKDLFFQSVSLTLYRIPRIA